MESRVKKKPGQQQQLQQQQQQLPAGGQDDAETARRQRKLLLRAEADAEVARRAFHSLIQLLEALDRPSSSWLTVQALRGQLLRPQPPVLTSEPPSSSSSIQWGASSSPPRAHTAPAGKQRSTHTGERAACSDSWRCGKLSGCRGGPQGRGAVGLREGVTLEFMVQECAPERPWDTVRPEVSDRVHQAAEKRQSKQWREKAMRAA
ncbi:hypothetical protein PLESTF_001972600 [Pleodorina starrii]|nr:hypothetical protein PLESTF_001972600 [Pleodorina starrii]